MISIHALRVEGDHIFDFEFPIFDISIHALRVEGDRKCPGTFYHLLISIHALRVEGDRCFHDVKHQIVLFLSTPSGWRATGISTTRPRKAA